MRATPIEPRMSDGWAFGTVVLEMFKGDRPRGADNNTEFEDYKRLRRGFGARIARWDVEDVLDWAREGTLARKVRLEPGGRYSDILEAFDEEDIDGLALLSHGLGEVDREVGRDELDVELEHTHIEP